MSNTQQTYIPSWAIQPLSEQLIDTDNAQTTASVIHWRSTAGGWTFVDVKVSPSGALQVGGNMQINDTTDTPINPATEEGLQDIVTAIGSISIPAPVGWATEAKQNVNNDLIDALYMLVKSIAFLPSVRNAQAWLRTSIENTPNIGTVTTVTTTTTVGTVNTVTNQSQVGGFQANPQIPSLMNQTAFNNLRNVIVS